MSQDKPAQPEGAGSFHNILEASGTPHRRQEPAFMLITLTILMNKSYSLDKEMIPFFSLHQDYSPRAPPSFGPDAAYFNGGTPVDILEGKEESG